MTVIPRFCFNFRHKCNMRCPYCYIPYVDDSPGTLDTWKKIVDKMAQFSPSLVTFGGGDPFAYPDFTELVKYSRQYTFKTHVDTNCIGLTSETLEELKDCIDILGVPMDGDESYHNTVRRHSKHHRKVSATLEHLSRLGIQTKINTVFFPNHEEQLYRVANQIKRYTNIKQWFIYEYWHFKDINSSSVFDYSSFDFDKEYVKLKELLPDVNIHFSPVSERAPSYLFVSSLGCLYTVSPEINKYIELGNILDKSEDEMAALVTNIENISRRTKIKL